MILPSSFKLFEAVGFMKTVVNNKKKLCFLCFEDQMVQVHLMVKPYNAKLMYKITSFSKSAFELFRRKKNITSSQILQASVSTLGMIAF